MDLTADLSLTMVKEIYMSKSTPIAAQSNANVLKNPFSKTLTKHCSSNSFISILKYKLRLWLYKHKSIQRHFRGVRYVLRFAAKIKLKIPFLDIGNQSALTVNHYPLFSGCASDNLSDIVNELNKNAYCYGPALNLDVVKDLNSRYLPQIARGYRNAYLQDKTLFDICHNETLISVARAYLGFEPTLHSCCVIVDIPGEKITDGGYEEGFHYDIAGIKSLNVFIYLSDVDCVSMPHMVIKGSHHGKRLRDIYNGYMSSSKAKQLYGDAITTLTGLAGTVIFENTEAFHRRGDLGIKGRVLVNILYTDGNKNLM